MNIRKTLKSLALAAATVLAFGAQAADYHWIGGASGNWNDGTKWSLSAGGTEAGAYPNNIDSDTATIDAAATITVPEELKANVIEVKQDVTFTGEGAVRFYTMNGDGKVTMSNVTFKTGAKGKNTVVENRVVIAAGETNVVNVCNEKNRFTFNNGLEGSGDLRVDEVQPLYYGYTVNGDCQNFSGSIVEKWTGTKNAGSQTGFGSALSVSPLASYTFNTRSNNGSNFPFSFSDGIVYIGALNGNIYLRKNSTPNSDTLVIGSRNEDCSFGGQLGYDANKYNRNIIKVGTAELEYTGTIYGYVNISNGTFRIGSAGSVPSYIAFNGGTLKQDAFDEDLDISAKIKNSNKQIVFDDEGVNHTWATALDVSNKKGLTKKGDGTLSLVKGQTFNGPLVVDGGKIGLASELSGEEETLFTWTTAGSSVTLDSFDIAVVAPLALALVQNAEAGTTSLVVERQVLTYTWVGASGSLWSDAANWKVGDDPAPLAPGASDTVTIGADAVIAVDADQEFGTVNADETAKLSILFTAEAQTFTAPVNFAGTIEAAAPFTATQESGVYTAGARSAATYTWAGEDGVWTDAKNWRIAGAATGVWPTTGDTASFTAAANGAVVTLANGIVISGATIAEGATITYDGASGMVDIEGDITGSGKLVLSNVGLYSTPTTSHNMINIETPIEVPEDSVAKFRIDAVKIGSSHYGCGFTLTGKLTGTGTIESYSSAGKSTNTNQGLHLEGDGSDFAGVVTVYSNAGQQRDTHTIKPCATSSNAVWRLYADGLPLYSKKTVFENSGTYYLGAVMYDIYDASPAKNSTYEIGALDQDSYFHSVNKGLANGSTIKWIAPTATFTNDVTNVGDLQILGGGTVVVTLTNTVPGRIMFADKGGTLKTKIVDDAKIDPSDKFLKCKAAICFDDEGEDYTWATAIADSNEGGLIKKGAGTLTIKKVALNGALQVLGGKIAISDAVTATGQELLSWDVVDGAQEVTLDDFDLTTVPAIDYAIVTNEARVALVTQRKAADYGYVGMDGGLWTDALNWNVSETATPFYPGEGDTATIGANVTITTAIGQVVKTLTIDASSKLAFDLSGIATFNEAVTLFSVTEGTCPLTADNVLLSGYDAAKYALVVTPGETALAVALYEKSKFVWTGNGGDNLFDTVGNWAYGAEGGPAAETYPNVQSTVIFPASFADGVVVDIDANYMGSDQPNYYCDMTLNCNVTLQSVNDSTYVFTPGAVSGSGLLTIDKIQLRTTTGKSISINSGLVVNTSAGLYIRGGNRTIELNGAVTGAGVISVQGDGNAHKKFYITGDMSGFAGTLDITTFKNCESLAISGDDTSIDLADATLNLASDKTLVLNGTYAANAFKVGSLMGSGVIRNETDNAMTLEVGSAADAESAAVLTQKDGVGAWTVKKVGTGAQKLTDATVAYNVDLTAGALDVPAGKAFGTVALNGGSFNFTIPYDSPWTNGTACALFTCTDGVAAGTEVNYVTLDLSAFEKSFDVAYDNSEANTLKVTLTPTVAPSVWNGPVNGLWSVAENWLVNDEPALVAPGAGDTAQIGAGAVILVDPDQGFGTVTADASAKLAVMFTEAGQKFTAPAEFAGTIVAAGPFEMDDEGVAARVPSTFIWTDSTADHEWNTLGNWKVGAYPTAVLPNGDDNTEFPAKEGCWTLSVNGSDGSPSNAMFAANVTLCDCTKYLRPKHVDGAGVITLGDNAKIAHHNAELTITNDIVVAAADDKMAELYVPSQASILVKGNVTGSGALKCWVKDGVNYSGVHFSGDLRTFTGRFVAPGNSIDRNQTQFEGEYSWSENARFEISAGGGDTCANAYKTFKFGSFSGKMNFNNQSTRGMTIEIGNLNSADDDIAGTFFSSSYPNLTAERGHTIRKVGTGTLEVSVINNKAYDVNGGVMRLMSDRTIRTMWKPKGNASEIVTDPAEATGSNDVSIAFSGTGTLALNPDITLDISGLIANSTGAIAIDDEGVDRTWSTALDASNAAAITKKGEGTLTLTEAPAWEGKTLVNVEAGSLVMPKDAPFTLGANTRYEIVGETRVFTQGTPNKPFMFILK